MRPSILSVLTVASVASAQTTSTPTPAPQVNTNPVGASYVGTLPAKADSVLRGTIAASTAPGGVKLQVSISGLPDLSLGPFIYHIHEKPVPADGNCTGTGAHLDPYKRGEAPPCDARNPETCQVGDLSGKHGNITTQAFSAEYLDPFVSLDPTSNAFFGNLSFVVHTSNKTRIGCANFTTLGAATPSGGFAAPTSNASNPAYPVAPTTTAPPPPPSYTGAASKIVGGTGALLGLAAALIL